MMLFFFILIVLVLIYAVVFLTLIIFWNKKDNVQKKIEQIPVSVIIPFRNEEKNLRECIDGILNQNYNQQLIEIICVNDHSIDNSLTILSSYNNIRIISLSNNKSGKKAALSTGIKASKNELLIFRDADTSSDPNWLVSLMSKQAENDCDFLIAPVKFKTKHTFLGAIQILEHLAVSFTGAAMAKFGKPILCNGANLLVKKSAFYHVNGFESHQLISSGDDVFLMNSFIQSNKKLEYIHSLDAVVSCEAEQSFFSFLSQRIRWVTKNKHNKNTYNFIIAFLIVVINYGLVFSGISVLLNSDYLNFFYWYSVIKLSIDSILLTKSAWHFKQLTMLCWLPVFFCVFAFEIIIILTLALFIHPKWKGRNISN
jgi:cellulose synthase/poly-beta-1,6-N-acetylglucosamine synthase-like glycosyltransferase